MQFEDLKHNLVHLRRRTLGITEYFHALSLLSPHSHHYQYPIRQGQNKVKYDYWFFT